MEHLGKSVYELNKLIEPEWRVVRAPRVQLEVRALPDLLARFNKNGKLKRIKRRKKKANRPSA